MHPAILNLTELLGSTHMSTPHSTGVLSPVLDSYRTAWKDTPIEYQTIKGTTYILLEHRKHYFLLYGRSTIWRREPQKYY